VPPTFFPGLAAVLRVSKSLRADLVQEDLFSEFAHLKFSMLLCLCAVPERLALEHGRGTVKDDNRADFHVEKFAQAAEEAHEVGILHHGTIRVAHRPDKL
jgi:hypothetical protein